MKKILLLILIVFVSSCAKVEEVQLCNPPYFEYKSGECCLDQDSNKICDIDEKEEETEEITEDKTEVEPEEQFITLKEGDSTIVYEKEIKLIEFSILDNRLDIQLNVNNKGSLFEETKKSEINNGLEIRVNSIDPLKRTATFKIKRFELKSNEYILYVNKPIVIKGYSILLENVDIRDNTAVYKITKNGNIVKEGRLMVGHTVKLENLKITNIKTFFHDSREDRYGLFIIE